MTYTCTILSQHHQSEERSQPTSVQDDVKALSISNKRVLVKIDKGKLIANGDYVYWVNESGIKQWQQPLNCHAKPNNAYISQDRILLTTHSHHYHRWGYLGPVLLIDLNTGDVITILKGNNAAALKNGNFILGLEGYDYFDTWLYNRNGHRLCHWHSYGHYIINENDDITVLECDRKNPTSARITQLKLDGNLVYGEPLSDGVVSNGLLLKNGGIVFVELGTVRIIDHNLQTKYSLPLLDVSPGNSWAFNVTLSFSNQDVLIKISKRSKEPPIEYTHHEWLLALVNS